MNEPSIGIVSLSPIVRDPRVRRQISALSGFRLTAYGYADPDDDPGCPIRGIPIPRRRGIPGQCMRAIRILLRRHEALYWSFPPVQAVAKLLDGHGHDLIIANDLDALPVALRAAAGAPVIFDAHEYAPLEWEDLWWWRWFVATQRAWMCQQYIPRAAAMTTVCQAIADRYQRDSGLNPLVVPNAAPYQDLSPTEVDPRRIRLVSHGLAVPSRRIEVTLEAMRQLDRRFHLTLILVPGDCDYIGRLTRIARDLPQVTIRPPLPHDRICAETNGFDLGVFLLPPVSFNYRYALPNKFFEFVQARLGVVIGPSPEMATLVNAHDLGVVAEDFTATALARALTGLTAAQVTGFKQAAHAAAGILNAGRYQGEFRALVAQVLAKRGH